jgi:hypothetical protein
MTTPNGMLSAREAAVVIGCGYRKALDLIGDKIPGHFDGYRWWTTERDIQAWRDANTVTGRHSKNRRRGRGRRAA